MDTPQTEVGNFLVLVVFGVLLYLGFHALNHKNVWQANYEVTTSEAVLEGPSFDSEDACLSYIHEDHPSTTYGWECGSNCKRFISDDVDSLFVCKETAQ